MISSKSEHHAWANRYAAATEGASLGRNLDCKFQALPVHPVISSCPSTTHPWNKILRPEKGLLLLNFLRSCRYEKDAPPPARLKGTAEMGRVKLGTDWQCHADKGHSLLG